MPVIYSSSALQNLKEIAAYGYEIWGAERSQSFLQKLQDEIALLDRFPQLGRKINGIETVNALPVRQLAFGNYSVLYAISSGDVFITAVLPKGRPRT